MLPRNPEQKETSMYLWLKPGAEKQLPNLKEQGVVGDLRVEIDSTSGNKYISTHFQVDDPTYEVAKALGNLIEKVTAKICIFRGLRAEGVYRHQDATLVANTSTRRTPDSLQEEAWQWLNVSGPSMEAVKSIHSLFRQGKLTPAENWEENIPLAHAAPSATKPTTENTNLRATGLPQVTQRKEG